MKTLTDYIALIVVMVLTLGCVMAILGWSLTKLMEIAYG